MQYYMLIRMLIQKPSPISTETNLFKHQTFMAAEAASPQGTGQQSGTIKKWLPRGFGFIEVENRDDVFVHFSNCDGREFLNIGENVTFDIETDDRSGKLRAVNVVGDGTGTPPDLSERDGGRGGGRGGRRGGRGGYGGYNRGG